MNTFCCFNKKKDDSVSRAGRMNEYYSEKEDEEEEKERQVRVYMYKVICEGMIEKIMKE